MVASIALFVVSPSMALPCALCNIHISIRPQNYVHGLFQLHRLFTRHTGRCPRHAPLMHLQVHVWSELLDRLRTMEC